MAAEELEDIGGTETESSTSTAPETAPETVSSVPTESVTQQPAPQPAEQMVSIADHLRTLGYGDLAGRYTDDAQLVADLVRQAQSAQQAQQFLPYAQRYFQHAGDFEQFLQQRQQAAQKPATPWWNPPEFQAGWRDLMRPDEQGNVRAPLDVQAKVQAYDQYRRDFAERFLSNPADTLKPFVEDTARQIAQQMVQDNMNQFSEQAYARQVVDQYSQIIHQRDQNGNLLRDPMTGQPVLSDMGRKFASYVEEAVNSGVRGVQAQERYAARLLRADLVSQQAASGVATNQTATENDRLKQQFARKPNPAGTVTMTPPMNGNAPPQNPQLSLAEQLRQALAAGGITDADVANSAR